MIIDIASGKTTRTFGADGAITSALVDATTVYWACCAGGGGYIAKAPR